VALVGDEVSVVTIVAATSVAAPRYTDNQYQINYQPTPVYLESCWGAYNAPLDSLAGGSGSLFPPQTQNPFSAFGLQPQTLAFWVS